MSTYIKKIRTDSGDLQIDYNALANLPELNTMFSNPNLLINSDFRNPVNQRGQTSYKSTANNFTRIFTIDRWNMQNGCECIINDASITLKGDSAASGASMFCQVMEVLPADTYTLQVKVKSMSNGADIKVTNSSSQDVFTNNLYTGLNTFTITNTDVFFITICLGSDSVIELEWIKLEQGSVGTPFVPRLYGEELALCQRYYEKRTVIFFPYGGVTPTTYYLAVNGDCYSVTKYRQPTLTASALTDHNNVAVDVSFVSATRTKDNIRLMTVSAACDKYLLRSDIEFDAEIY